MTAEPIVQDTATVPCWMADYEGKRYYLGIQQEQSSAFHPPWLSHQVLVEGVARAEIVRRLRSHSALCGI